MLNKANNKDETSDKGLWNTRYKEHGALWGWEPSQTAILMNDDFAPGANVIDIGFGYARDTINHAQQGYLVKAFEKSVEGFLLAERKINELNLGSRLTLTLGDFSTFDLGKGAYDAIQAHRVAHLWDEGKVRAFNNIAARALKTHGRIYVACRDPRDFDPEQMEKLEDGSVVYKKSVQGREGHVIRFWDQNRYEETFSKKFNILNLIQGEEIESITNPGKMAHYTVMVAEKREKPPAKVYQLDQ